MPTIQAQSAVKPSWRSLRGKGTRPERISEEDRYLLVRQLAVLQKAGVPLLSSLGALEKQLPVGPLKRVVHAVSQDLLNGQTLSQAFARHPESFDSAFVGLIRIGEAGGLLEAMLKRLAELAEWEQDFASRIKEALQYPAIVLGTLAVALTIMVTVVLPKFAKLFLSWSIDLPLQTRVILGFSRIMTQHGWLIGLGLVVGTVAFLRYIRTTRGRLWWHKTLIRLPIVGPVFVQLAMSRFSRVVSVLSTSGVPMLETLALAGECVNNDYIQQGLGAVIERVKGGEPLASALKTDSLFPPIVVQMVATGEETGHIDELLHNVSDYYDQQVSYVVKRLITFVEPALLIVVGLGVLLMASSVLLPMWNMVQVLKH